jgi:hypothetical protein
MAPAGYVDLLEKLALLSLVTTITSPGNNIHCACPASSGNLNTPL